MAQTVTCFSTIAEHLIGILTLTPWIRVSRCVSIVFYHQGPLILDRLLLMLDGPLSSRERPDVLTFWDYEPYTTTLWHRESESATFNPHDAKMIVISNHITLVSV